MKVQKATPKKKTEKIVALARLSPGQVFRFAHISFEAAMAGKDDASFYMVIDVQPKKTGRVNIVSVDGKSVLERDEDHQVIVHEATLNIERAERS